MRGVGDGAKGEGVVRQPNRPEPTEPEVSGNVQVVFMPSGRRGLVPRGTSVLDAARSLGVYVESVCGGQGLCSRCQVEVAEGRFAKLAVTSSADHLTGITEAEVRWRERRRLKAGRRLGCRAKLMGDVVIDVPADAQINAQIVRKRAETRSITPDPATRLFVVQVEEPDMHQPMGDFERLKQALFEQYGLADLEADLLVLADLQRTLRAGGWLVTVAVYQERAGQGLITAIWPGHHDRPLGVAVDLGSTTIAAHLCDLRSGRVLTSAGMMNPQIRFGEDVMSRVSYVQMNAGGHLEMARVIREALNVLIGKVAGQAEALPSDLVEATIVGNPIMHHLFLGLDPTELGGAPFALAAGSAIRCAARELDLDMAPGARLYVLPCIAGHVGADAAAVALAEARHKQDALTLIADVGTNAEIILGNKDRLVAASSPTGPAFEGAEIACGQRAAGGTIERVRIDDATLEPRFKIIGSDLWSDDDGFAEEAAKLGVTGICGSGIIEVIGEMFRVGLIRADGVIDESLAERTARLRPSGRTWHYVIHEGDPQLYIQQTDVRAIQLAKAALHAGIKLLMARLGVDHVDRIRLAGAFGSHIDVTYAMLLGMIPDCPVDKVAAVGNAAGTGARMALLDKGARAEVEALVQRIEKVETAIEGDFQDQFVQAMALPHLNDPYTELGKVIGLPVRPQVSASGRKGGRRQRVRA
ncbi:MAG: ASKHA domain-containing protein [Geminicoccaceae bacterium]